MEKSLANQYYQKLAEKETLVFEMKKFIVANCNKVDWSRFRGFVTGIAGSGLNTRYFTMSPKTKLMPDPIKCEKIEVAGFDTYTRQIDIWANNELIEKIDEESVVSIYNYLSNQLLKWI